MLLCKVNVLCSFAAASEFKMKLICQTRPANDWQERDILQVMLKYLFDRTSLHRGKPNMEI